MAASRDRIYNNYALINVLSLSIYLKVGQSKTSLRIVFNPKLLEAFKNQQILSF